MKKTAGLTLERGETTISSSNKALDDRLSLPANATAIWQKERSSLFYGKQN